MSFTLFCQSPDFDLTVSLHIEVFILAWEDE